MVDGIDRTRTQDEASRLVSSANDRFVAGESPVVTAARNVIRDHERDPSDGTVRVFGGRDEGRLVSAVSRIAVEARDPAEIEGRLKADVAIQRMGAQRERDLTKGLKGASTFEKRDVQAVHGDVTAIVTEPSKFTAGSLASGRFEGAHPDARKRIVDAISFSGREAALNADRSHGAGANMARIGAFASSAVAAPSEGVRSVAKGGPQAPSLVEQSINRDGGRGR